MGVFHRLRNGTGLRGTFLTTLGDYRYLAGRWQGRELALSCFDGAHAFLFKARLSEAGELRGDFWSGGSWHDTFTGRRAPRARLADPWQLTKTTTVTGKTPRDQLSDLRFQDLAGVQRSLNDAEFAGACRLLVVFGSWCPNCKDEMQYLVDLDRRYRHRGLSIVGLAFERTGDVARDRAQLKIYRKRLGIRFPILLAGVADKTKASRALPLLDKVRAYPTSMFVDRAGTITAVHTGFAGPATGAGFRRLKARFEALIEKMLATAKSKKSREPRPEAQKGNAAKSGRVR